MAMYVPVFLTLGVPLEALGLMLAVDVIPDTFQTVGNVTAGMAAAAIVARGSGEPNGALVGLPRRRTLSTDLLAPLLNLLSR